MLHVLFSKNTDFISIKWLHDQYPRKNGAGPEDRTRNLLNTSRTRIRPSYRVRRESGETYYLTSPILTARWIWWNDLITQVSKIHKTLKKYYVQCI